MSKQTAIFTNSNGRVVLRHRKPKTLSQSRQDAAALLIDTDSIPEPPELGENEVAVMYVNNGEIEYKVEEFDADN